MTTPQPAALPEPIPMVLHCPKCGMQHIDAPESGDVDDGHVTSYGWENPPHRSHLCHGCGTIWRPADVPTTGVKSISTKGKADTWPTESECALAALQSQPAAPGVTGAVQTLIETLKADPEYAWAWHCNVAMAAVDEGLSHYAANKAAARFLSWFAQIDTTKHPGFPKAPEQPAAAGVSDAEIDRILSTPIPGGSVASHWFLPHDTGKGLANVRDVVRAMLTSARAILALRPQAVPMTEDTARLDWLGANPACKIFNEDGQWSFDGKWCLDLRDAIDNARGITAPAGGEKQA